MAESLSPGSTEDNIENYKDKIHRLELAYNNLKQQKDTEVEYFREEIVALEKIIKSNEKDKLDLTNQIKQLNGKYDECATELAEKNAENEQLQADLEKQIKLNLKSNCSIVETSTNLDEIEIYKTANAELKATIKNLESTLLSQSVQFSNHEAQIKESCRVIEDLKETLELKTSLISELNDKIKTQEEMYSENLNAALQSNVPDGDDKRRGNSLFSELDTRRTKVEEELIRLRERVHILNVENARLQTKLSKGDHVNSVILTQLQAVQKSQDKVATEINKWKSESLHKYDFLASRVERLREEYQLKLTKISANVDPSEIKVLEERDTLFVQNMSLNKEILDLKRELKISQHLKTEMDAKQVINSVRRDNHSNNNNPESTKPNGLAVNANNVQNPSAPTDPGCTQQ